MWLTNSAIRSEFQVFFESNATSLLSLAYSLVIDLKLDKSAKAMTLPPRTLLHDAWDTFKYPTVRLRPELSLEEKRALLGYYHQSSMWVPVFCFQDWILTATVSPSCTDGAKHYLGQLISHNAANPWSRLRNSSRISKLSHL